MSLFWRTTSVYASHAIPGQRLTEIDYVWQVNSDSQQVFPLVSFVIMTFLRLAHSFYMTHLSDIIFCLSCILVDWHPCSTWLPDSVLMSWCLLHGWLAGCVCPGKRAISLSSHSSQEAKTWSDLRWTGTQNLSYILIPLWLLPHYECRMTQVLWIFSVFVRRKWFLIQQYGSFVWWSPIFIGNVFQLFAAIRVKDEAQNKGYRRLGTGRIAQPTFILFPYSLSFMVAWSICVNVPALEETSGRPPIELYIKVSWGKCSSNNYFCEEFVLSRVGAGSDLGGQPW